MGSQLTAAQTLAAGLKRDAAASADELHRAKQQACALSSLAHSPLSLSSYLCLDILLSYALLIFSILLLDSFG